MASDIRQLDFKKMKSMGMEKIIFTQTNILTKPNDIEFIDEEIKEAFLNARECFGKRNILVLSNFTDDKVFLDQYSRFFDEKSFHDTLHLDGLFDVGFVPPRLVGYRPFNFKKLKKFAEYEFNFNMTNPSKIVLIGNQLTTDIFLGNLNDMATVWIHRGSDYFNDDKFKMQLYSYKKQKIVEQN